VRGLMDSPGFRSSRSLRAPSIDARHCHCF
jgi:hypothetical protein